MAFTSWTIKMYKCHRGACACILTSVLFFMFVYLMHITLECLCSSSNRPWKDAPDVLLWLFSYTLQCKIQGFFKFCFLVSCDKHCCCSAITPHIPIPLHTATSRLVLPHPSHPEVLGGLSVWGHLLEDALNYCWISSVVFSDACSDPRNNLLSLLMTIVA